MLIEWEPVHKGDIHCREMADRHYTRQSPGASSWTRPGYNLVLWMPKAVFCWWRPKWEDGRPGTERKDKLRAIECTMFRNEGNYLSSTLIQSAVMWLDSNAANDYLHYDTMGLCKKVITGVSSSKTTKRRSRRSSPGQCFIQAGWKPFEKRGGKADVWLEYTVNLGRDL